jgi:hypothetical protein
MIEKKCISLTSRPDYTPILAGEGNTKPGREVIPSRLLPSYINELE